MSGDRYLEKKQYLWLSPILCKSPKERSSNSFFSLQKLFLEAQIMKHNFYNTLSVITTGVILGLFALAPNSAEAAAIRFDFLSTFENTPDDKGA